LWGARVFRLSALALHGRTGAVDAYEDILRQICHPSQYVGAEINARRKDPAQVRCRVALAYPDLYEIGMSYLGFQILYQRVNAQDDLAAERFMPRTRIWRPC
jgi:hypothetical protein